MRVRMRWTWVLQLFYRFGGLRGFVFAEIRNDAPRSCKLGEIMVASGAFDLLTNIRSVLLLLDDLWGKLDLDEVGIPFADKGNNPCKIILTSRNENVLVSQMNCIIKKKKIGVMLCYN